MNPAQRRLNGLRWRMAAMRRLWRTGAVPEMTFLPAGPFDAEPRGKIDVPGPKARIKGEILDVYGWAMFPSSPTTRVEVWLGETPLGLARLGVPRPDIGALTENPFAGISGFHLSADLTEIGRPLGTTSVRVRAVSAAGENLELGPAPVTVVADESKRSGPKDLPPPPMPTPRADGGTGRPILIYTHQLNLGGAQLYLMDLLRELLKQGTVRPTVVSAMDGLLRGELEEMGIPVHISSPTPMDDFSCHIGRVEELTAWARDREFELVLINTATGLILPGAELAAELGIPAVWAIHESFPLATLWGNPDPRIREYAETVLGKAALAIFEADATRRMFEGVIGPERGLVLPYGLDLDPIDAERKSFDETAARREEGIPEDAELILCVGTIEPRKAQLPLAQAFDMIARRHPAARLVFVGANDKPDSLLLAERVEASSSAEQIELVDVTPDVQRWYGMADLLVCASDVESLPRTVLEAMAWETPVLATNVFGLPELIDDGETGWLCEPRDTVALANALDRVLNSTKEEREKLGRAARMLVEKRHSLERYGQEVARLLEQVASRASAAADLNVTPQ